MQGQFTIGNSRVKRFSTGQLQMVAVGLGLAAIIAIGAIGIRLSETTPARSMAETRLNAPLATELGSYTYHEQNVDLLTGTGAAPGHQAASNQPVEVTRYVEQNTWLPGSDTPAVAQEAARHGVTVAEWVSFLDVNRNPSDTTTGLPGPAGTGLTDY